MARVRSLGAVALGLTASACGSGSERPALSYERPDPKLDKRNVVVYLVDTLRADHLGCYGYERETSPRIDAFAEEGILFANCLAQSTWTKPATASVLTGEYPARHGATNDLAAISPELPTLAERLQAAGWRTAGFVANGFVGSENGGFRRGFESFEYRHRGDQPYAVAELVLDDALAWLAENASEPFFLYVHTVDPHAPYGPPAPFRARFASGVVEKALQPPRGTTAVPEAERQRLVDLYDAEIAYSDHHFGRLLDNLRDLGRADDTLVVFLSDHGEEFFEHGEWGHNPRMYQEVVHVPLIWRIPDWPEEGRGLRHEGLVLQVDVVPTLLDALGLEPDPALPGTSLLERCTRPPDSMEVGISEADHWGTHRKAVVASGKKYIRQWSPDEREYLFDLEDDPGEERNLLRLAGRERDAELHRSLLEQFRAATNEGFSLMIQSGWSEALAVECLVFTRSAPLERSLLFYSELTGARKGPDGPIERSKQRFRGEDLYVTSARFDLKPGEADGLAFVPAAAEETVHVALRVGNAWVPPGFIRLGAEGSRAAGPLVELEVASEALDAPAFPADEDLAGAPLRVRIWRNLTARTEETELSEEALEALRAIGYLGDE